MEGFRTYEKLSVQVADVSVKTVQSRSPRTQPDRLSTTFCRQLKSSYASTGSITCPSISHD